MIWLWGKVNEIGVSWVVVFGGLLCFGVYIDGVFCVIEVMV